jgi:anti-anti-sigma factor
MPVLETFRVETNGTPGYVRLVGELDLASVRDFRVALENVSVDRGLTLDLAQLTYIDSSGLHAIVECATQGDGDETVRIVNAGDHVMRVFQIVGLDRDPRIVLDVGGSNGRQ